MSAQEKDPGSLKNLLAFLKRHSRNKDIQALLRIARKDNPEVRVSGKDKDELIANLEGAIELRATTSDSAYKLLCDSELSQPQLILMFRPISKEAKALCNDGEGIAKRLFGSEWPSGTGFPRFFHRPDGAHWSDFRVTNYGEKGTDWTAKIYAGIIRWVRLDRDFDSTTRIETIRRQQRIVHETYHVNWDRRGLLEIRIPPPISKKDFGHSMEIVWGLLGKGIDRNHFVGFDLMQACKKLIGIAALEEKGLRYTFYTAEVENQDHVVADVRTHSQSENLLTYDSMEKLMAAFEKCHVLGIGWKLAKEMHGEDKVLFSLVGRFGTHSVITRSKTTAKAVQYVVDRLRQLA